MGDEKGEFTYQGPKGDSVVGYVMVREEAIGEKSEFKIVERTESDHQPITVRIKNKNR